MANYRAISTGNASDLARWEVWNGLAWVAATVLPTVADNVYSNGFTVTIDQDFFAGSYYSANVSAPSGIVSGGYYILNGGVTATGDFLNHNVTLPTGVVYHNAASDSYIVGSVSSIPPSTANQKYGAVAEGTGVLHIIGNVQGGARLSSTTAAYGVVSFGSGSFIVYGDSIGGTHNSYGAYNQGSGGTVLGVCTGAAAQGAKNCTVSKIQDRGAVECHITDEIILDADNLIFGNSSNTFSSTVRIVGFTTLGQTTFNSLLDQDQADEADVRLGTSYANGALTGTLAVPPAGAVSLGVPVDNTTGTGSVTSAEIRDLILPSILSAITQP